MSTPLAKQSARVLHTAIPSLPRSPAVGAGAAASPFMWGGGSDSGTVVVDIDETMLFRRNAWQSVALYTIPTTATGVAHTGVTDALRAVAEKHRVVAVSARWHGAAGNTERWLQHHGLHGLPVVLARHMLRKREDRVAFKTQAIEGLRAAGWRPFAGVGDRPSDMEAYVSTGLVSLMVDHFPGLPPGGEGGVADFSALVSRITPAGGSKAVVDIEDAPKDATRVVHGSPRLGVLADLKDRLSVPDDVVQFFAPRPDATVWQQVAERLRTMRPQE